MNTSLRTPSPAVLAGGFAALFAGAVVAGRATRVAGSEISMVWPAAAVAVVWVLSARTTRETWVAVTLLGVVAFAATYLTGVDLDLSLGFTVVNVLIGWGTARLLGLRGRVRLEEPGDLGWLVACVLAATGVAALLGGLLLSVHDGASLWRSTAVFWLRNGVTVLLGVTLLVAARQSRTWRLPTPRRLAGDLAVWAFAVLVYAVVFVAIQGVPVAFVVLPVGVVIALRWSTLVVVLHLLASDVFVLVATAAGRGPFTGVDPMLQAALAQGLIGCALLLALTVALYRDSREALLRELDQAHRRTQAAAEQLRHSSLHDPLTGLANRQRLFEVIEEEIEVGRRTGNGVGVVFLDLDGFKAVNDTWGHAAGDRLLQGVAERLQALSRSEDAVARLGGDEFVMVCRRVSDQQQLDLIARRVAEALAHPHDLGGPADVHVAASTGTAWTGGGTTAEQLVHEADTAMYAAKRRLRLLAEAPAPAGAAS